jgi:hypothetical protein
MIFYPSTYQRSDKDEVHHWCREGYLTLYELRQENKLHRHYKMFKNDRERKILFNDFVMYLNDYIYSRDATYQALLREGVDCGAFRHCITEQNEIPEDD